MTSRRDFVAAGAAGLLTAALSPAGISSAAAVPVRLDRQDSPHRIDALCYSTAPIDADDVKAAVAGGLTAAVIDLFGYPRDYASASQELARWTARFADPGFSVRPIRQAADFDLAKRERRLGVVLASQDASILGVPSGEYAQTLRMFHALGLRVLQLSHNNRTVWAESYMEKRDGGLSLAGAALVGLMNETGVIVDLSHCSRQTLLDAVERSAKPCAVTHAGCRALAPTARNKSDEEIRALGRGGGFFGVYNMTTWLTDKPTASLATVLDHIDHAVQLIGAAHVGFGSDGAISRLDAAAETARMARVQAFNKSGPSFEWPVRHVRVPELNAPDRLSALGEGLAKRKYSDADIAGIVGGNFVRLFAAVCG